MAGAIVHVEIPASDTERSRAFWSGLFGWRFETYPPGSEYHMTQLDERSGVAVTGMEQRSSARVYFDVDDIRAAIARVVELGGEADEPMPVPSMGWFVHCRDAEGVDFGLWQTDPEAPATEMPA
ncbi:MAG TPA: VOC family protein [Gaiellaceae bacterium]|nr:VOC family protein [Gaiellaceae bacterium]